MATDVEALLNPHGRRGCEAEMTTMLGRFIVLPTAERNRTIEAAIVLLIVRIALGVLPFARALRLLGLVRGGPACGRACARTASEVGRAVVRASRHVPFRAVCLQQAFAARVMLRRRGIVVTIHLGVARAATGEVAAHAWSLSGDVPVTGVAAARDFVPLAVFA
jgi:hypothetical protein